MYVIHGPATHGQWLFQEGADGMSGATVAIPHTTPKTTSPVLEVHWPWWLHPVWALLLMVGTTAVASIVLPPPYYRIWGTNKFLNHDSAGLLLLGIILMLVGILAANHRNARGGHARIVFSPTKIAHLQKTYKILLALTLLGYAFWGLIAISEGVRAADLFAVLQRDEGAIGELKANSRPVGGVTTLAQFGPVAVVLGFVLRKIGVGGRSYWVIIVLALVRATFYAERLALLEILLPLVLITAITMVKRSRWRPLVQIMPLVLGPLVWVIFAISEYSRSWVYYQNVVSLPFSEWVTSRLLGYYITSFNNSALFADSWRGLYEPPYMSIQAFWNAPGVSALVGHPSVLGLHPDKWWSSVLQARSNPEFTNVGSFLVTYAEMGWPLASVFWLAVGWILGSLFSAVTRGSFAGLIAYCALFIGLLELPRFIYWTQGRTIPVIIGLLVVWWMFRSAHAEKRTGADRS